MATLAVRNRVSRRDTVEFLRELFGVEISTASIDATVARTADAGPSTVAGACDAVGRRYARSAAGRAWRAGREARHWQTPERLCTITREKFPAGTQSPARRRYTKVETMTSKGSGGKARTPGPKSTAGGTARRVVADSRGVFLGAKPTVEVRSPLFPPIPFPGEELLFDLHQRIGQGRAYESLDELNREMRRLTMSGPIPRSEPTEPGARAQRLMFDAWERPEDGPRLAEEALTLDPDCVDAHLFLAMTTAERPEQAMKHAFTAIETGARMVELETEAAEKGHLWSHLPARPYLRARAFLARYVWGLGGRIMATTLARDTLELDGDDALGLRYLLLSWYLDMGEEMLTRELLERFKGERSTFMLYGDALLTFWDRGEDRTTTARLNKALKANRHVPGLLLGTEQADISVLAIDAYAAGSEAEAVICAHLLIDPWERDIEALEWLDEATEGRPWS